MSTQFWTMRDADREAEKQEALKNLCKDCGKDMGYRGLNHEYCTRCISSWYAENNIDPSETPNGDFE